MQHIEDVIVYNINKISAGGEIMLICKSFIILSISVLLLLCLSISCDQDKSDSLKNNQINNMAYLGQKPPGMVPEKFAEGILPTDGIQHCFPAFSPDGNEVYWMNVDMEARKGIIKYMEVSDGVWSKPEIASFSGEFNDHAPVFSSDGKRIYFASSRPSGTGKGKNIWYVERNESGWSDPVNLGSPPNTELGASQPSLTRDGSIYFVGILEGAQWNTGIYRSKIIDGSYSDPEPVVEIFNTIEGKVIDTTYVDYTPYIAPDESYLIFSSSRPGRKSTETDMYVSFKNKYGSWREPVNMGDKINNGMTATFPFVSHDGKYLFFNRFDETDTDVFFWVSSKVIDEFR